MKSQKYEDVTLGEFILRVKEDLLAHTASGSVCADFEVTINKYGKLCKKQKINLHLQFSHLLKANKQEYQS